ncbi:universal stress protein [Christiangramia sabulilitoris]|uniref:Universal stress protein n=1 Tax=Christiangramia sabulilitoris TaxID=2583991 RepID=A0A550I6N0_9FLAO|nr:universal stress protein [Christiangramia sabulilitoris]TRO66623.1 universal stress protein [Christiangramia sabulilitoris]
MKKILLPTDFSEVADYSLRYAANLAKKYNAEIVALYMIDREDAFLTRQEAMQLFENIDYRKRIEQSFKDFLNKDYLSGIKVHTVIKRHVDFTRISELLEELEIDLIVMGTHGAHGLGGMFFGSNAEKVVRTSKVPTLIVKMNRSSFKLDKVVLACDLDLEMTDAFEKASRFLKDNNLDFDIFYVNTPEDFMSTALMEKGIEKFSASLNDTEENISEKIIMYDDYNIEAGIYNYAKKVDADLIVILTHGRKGLSKVIFNSYGEKMANQSATPVLTVQA